MFNSFKFGGPDRSGGDYSQDEKSSVQHSHTVSTELSDDDKSEFDVKEGPSSSTAGEPVDRATGLPPGSPRRTFASVMSDIFRRSSETSNKDGSDPPSRKHSQQTEPSRARGVATALGLFQSHNPDVDSEEAAAVNSPFPRKGSVVSNHSGEDIPSPIPEMTRRPSYMPRNATASFLKTANGTSEVKPEEKEKMEAEKAAAGRKPSVMGSVMGVGAGGDAAGTTATGGRRPSGMVPNNVAARYVRSAGSGHGEEDRPDLNSRRRSSTRKSVSDAQIRAVPMQADQFQQWQNSVQRNGSRVSFAPPIVRQRSVDDVAEDVEGEEQEMIAQSNKHQNGRAKIVTISVQPATPERNTKDRANQPMRQTKPMSAFLPEDMGPVPSNFGAEIDHDLSQITETDSRPETPLESLGFHGAVPA